MSLLLSILCTVCFCLGLIQNGAPATWIILATSPLYTNTKLSTSLGNPFSLRYVPKEMLPNSARLACSRSCAFNPGCLAFNFYATNTSYICELLPENLCSSSTSKTLTTVQGSSVWDRVSTGSTCIDIPVETIRPGCQGTWPNFFNCTQTCGDCYKRLGLSGRTNCTLWPDRDGLRSVRLDARCSDYETLIVMQRKVDLTTGQVIDDYRMSFPDIYRNLKQGGHPHLRFMVEGPNGSHYAHYDNWIIDTNGMLSNLTYKHGDIDIFDLWGKSLQPTPFVTVTDDRFGCGSFWLMDPTNGTYCPGGFTGMFGIPKMNGSRIVSTGIRSDSSHPSMTEFNEALIMIMPT